MTLVILLAVGGTLTSFFMPYVGAKNPHQPIDLNIFRSTKQLLKDTFAQRELYTAIIGISWFWLIGAVYTTQLPTFTQKHLGGNDNVFNLMLALFSVGIAAGSILCSKLSRHRLHLRLVSVGTLGLTASGILLVWLTHGNHYQAGQFQDIFGFLSNRLCLSRYGLHDCHRLLRRLFLRTALHLAANRQQRRIPRQRHRRQ